MRRCWVTAVTVIPSGLERSDTDIGPALKRRMIRRRVESPRAFRIRSTLPMRTAVDVAIDTLLAFLCRWLNHRLKPIEQSAPSSLADFGTIRALEEDGLMGQDQKRT